MKKFIGACLVFFTLCKPSYALPVGNPAEASLFCDSLFSWCWCENFGVRLGYYGDFVFDRKMKLDAPSKDCLRRTEIYTNAGYLVINFLNRVDVFGTLGATKINIDANNQNFSPRLFPEDKFQKFNLETDTNFSWRPELHCFVASSLRRARTTSA